MSFLAYEYSLGREPDLTIQLSASVSDAQGHFIESLSEDETEEFQKSLRDCIDQFVVHTLLKRKTVDDDTVTLEPFEIN